MRPVFVLLHSLSLGPASWRQVAGELEAAGHQVRVPSMVQAVGGESESPFWPAAVGAVRDGLDGIPGNRPVVLVPHSNVGRLIPVIGAGIDHPVAASVFVEGALPARSGQTPVTGPGRLESVRAMAVNGRLPRWTDRWDEAEIAPLFPDPAIRQAVTDEQPEVPLAYYEQAVPVPDGWDDHPCSYLLFSAEDYGAEAEEARERGWTVEHLPGGHLHQLVDPQGTARHIIGLAGLLHSRDADPQ